MTNVETVMGSMLISMADKVLFIDKFTPGSKAKGGFTMDGTAFTVELSVAKEEISHD